MLKKFAVCAMLAAGIASAASYRIRLMQSSTIKGTELKAGEYRLNVENDKVKIVNGKDTVEAPVKVENADEKFSNTAIRYNAQGVISEIRIGGTKTRLVFAE